MTTPLLEPLLAATAPPAASSAARDAAQRPFRDLLTPAPRPVSDALPAAHDSSLETTEDVPASVPATASSSEDRDEETPHGDELRSEAGDTATPVTTAPVAVVDEAAEANAADNGVAAVAIEVATDDEQEPPPVPLPEAKEKPQRKSTEIGDASETLRRGDATDSLSKKESGVIAAKSDASLPTEAEIAAQEKTSTAIDSALPLAVASETSSAESNESQGAAGEKFNSDVVRANLEPHGTRRRSALPASDDGRGAAESADVQATTESAAGDAVAPSAAPERSKSKSRDSEAKAGKSPAEGTVQRGGTASELVTTAPPADAQTPATSLTTSVAEGPYDAQSTVAPEAAVPRGEAAQPHGLPPTASPERLAALVAQRRVKPAAGGHGQPLTESQQARLVQRVAKAFETARMRGDAEIRLRLSPPELGSLKLEVRLESGVLTARLEVETAAAQQALADNLATLRHRLAEQNIRVEQFDIDLLDRRDGNSPESEQNQFANGERHAPQRGPRANGHNPSANATEAATQARRIVNTNSSSLDVMI